MRIRTYPKINLTLDVLRRREDGYHEVEMIMQTIGICDEITLTVTKERGIMLETNLYYVPCDERNTVYQACQLFFEKYGICDKGVKIYVKKRVPVAAGIAGGSANAAGTLKALNKLFGVFAPQTELMELGAKIGADVPYCLLGKTALATGIGCDLQTIAQMPPLILCIAKPNFSVKTPEVYGALDADNLPYHPDTQGMIRAIEEKNVEKIASLLSNVLETVTAQKYPQIDAMKKIMLESGALGAVMSGSGPTVFGIFSNKEDAYKARNILRKKVGYAQVTGIKR